MHELIHHVMQGEEIQTLLYTVTNISFRPPMLFVFFYLGILNIYNELERACIYLMETTLLVLLQSLYAYIYIM